MKSERQDASRRATDYWQESQNTFLASKDYYDRVESALQRDVLPILPKLATALDVGCGNGRFTLLLAGCAGQILANDLSPALITAARADAVAKNVTNATFEVSDVTDFRLPSGPFDLVSCMGVMSTLARDEDVDRLMRELTARTRPGGYVLLRESLSLRSADEAVLTATPPAVYRSRASYVRKLASLGLMPVKTICLKTWPKYDRANYLFLLRRRFRFWSRLRHALAPQRIFDQATDFTKSAP